MKLLGILILVGGILFVGDKLYTSKKVDDFCKGDKECLCVVNYILDDITIKEKYEAFISLNEGQLPTNFNTIKASFKATLVCMD